MRQGVIAQIEKVAWMQEEQALWPENGGHGMVFRAHDGRLFITFHQPNETPNERGVFRQVREENDSLKLVENAR